MKRGNRELEASFLHIVGGLIVAGVSALTGAVAGGVAVYRAVSQISGVDLANDRSRWHSQPRRCR